MAPIEDLQSRDLAWISDFVMQQMVIMLRPMMDHLQQTDAAVDYTQRAVQRLGMDVSEVKGDVERTNKYLAILRQGLGVQNEGKCVLQRGLESTARTVKRLDDQMESVLALTRGVEDGLGQQRSDTRGLCARQEDLAKQAVANASALEDLRGQLERVSNDARALGEGLLDSEARLEGWHRELRELRRGQLGLAPKLEDKAMRPPPSSQGCRPAATDSWPQKKMFAPVDVAAGGAGAPGISGFGDTASSHGGGSQQSKRISRVGSGSGRGALPQEHPELAPPPRSSSRAAARGTDVLGADEAGATPGDEAPGASRLPTLAARQPGAPRPVDRATAEGPRLRFTATMAKPPSRGSPS